MKIEIEVSNVEAAIVATALRLAARDFMRAAYVPPGPARHCSESEREGWRQSGYTLARVALAFRRA